LEKRDPFSGFFFQEISVVSGELCLQLKPYTGGFRDFGGRETKMDSVAERLKFELRATYAAVSKPSRIVEVTTIAGARFRITF